MFFFSSLTWIVREAFPKILYWKKKAKKQKTELLREILGKDVTASALVFNSSLARPRNGNANIRSPFKSKEEGVNFELKYL